MLLRNVLNNVNMEEFRSIQGYEGIYQVSGYGRVKSLKFGKEKFLKPIANSCGYLYVRLCKDGKSKCQNIHRLVAQAFIPNPLGLPQVNHKDEDKANNRVENLEWCDRSYNCNYGTRIQRVSEVRSKQVYQYSLNGELVAKWLSTAECGKNGFNQAAVSDCCNNKRKTHKGYIWKYEA